MAGRFCTERQLCFVFYTDNEAAIVTIQQPLSLEVFWHKYAKIPRHTSKNAITEGDFICIFACNCEGTEQLPVVNKFYSQADIRNPLRSLFDQITNCSRYLLLRIKEFSTFSLESSKALSSTSMQV